MPGLLAGGPNPGEQDHCHYDFHEPETAYVDSDCAYASNEIAINWNSPLVYLSNAIEALCGTGTRGSELATRARDEAVACFGTAGIAFVDSAEDQARRGDLLRRRPAEGAPDSGASSWQSLARATGSIEADHLNGEIALLGRLHGVPTPVNTVLQREANRMAGERRSPGSMTHDELLAALREVER